VPTISSHEFIALVLEKYRRRVEKNGDGNTAMGILGGAAENQTEREEMREWSVTTATKRDISLLIASQKTAGMRGKVRDEEEEVNEGRKQIRPMMWAT
jgi:hypothetical protein